MAKCSDGRRNNKPPISSQFKPGVSPNPSGRPPGGRNRKTIVQDAFNAKVALTENGKRRKVTKYESGMIQLATKFALGDLKAFPKAVEVMHQFGLIEHETAVMFAKLSEHDEPVIDDIVRRIREADPTLPSCSSVISKEPHQ